MSSPFDDWEEPRLEDVLTPRAPPAPKQLRIPFVGDSLDAVELPAQLLDDQLPHLLNLPGEVEHFEDLTTLALRKHREILSLPLDRSRLDFQAILRAQTSSAQSVLTAQVRVDEGRLRQKQTDTLGKLLEVLEKERKRVPVLIENDPSS
jgi:hypothetical protein